MSFIKSPEEIKILREGGKRLAYILRVVGEKAVAGVSTEELNTLAQKLTEDGGDVPAFLNYSPGGGARPYPASLCVSINDEIVHGIPNESKRILKEGDIVSLDMGIIHKGLVTDSAITVGVGVIDNKAQRLIDATRHALFAGIDVARDGVNVAKIGAAVEDFAHDSRFSVAEELGGHGVGHEVHEDPFIPNYRIAGKQSRLMTGMVIAIEPMLCEGKGKIKFDNDGWTIKTSDGKRAAHFEHTIVITDEGSEILTQEDEVKS
ncbi:MAG: type I methionyl aminopeptidase [Candidatus Paceibacterota bacterium]|jgi:methionyl aminopeptidase